LSLQSVVLISASLMP